MFNYNFFGRIILHVNIIYVDLIQKSFFLQVYYFK